MSKIVIGVACHKPSELPSNELYLPIHVGAALATKGLPGLQRDDEGDNISEKNPQYCELTAQYWLWKNVDADYYGLCHYRRFMSFAPERFDNLSGDHRDQVIIESLNDFTKKKYCLEDEAGMREMIEGFDVVATENQNLSRVYTPRGPKRSVYDHFAAHDRDLINVEDLDAMLGIVQEKYPQYYADLREYIGRPYFRGYNCFVMKRDLFFELCAYEFDVLGELEKRVDFSTYDLTRTRIYGFMAEILYSGFVYHLSKSRNAKVRDVQMLFFIDPDKKEPIKPIPDAVPVMFVMVNAPAFLFEVTARSFLRSLDPAKRYDVLVLHTTFTSFYKTHYEKLFEAYENVTIRFLDWGKMERALSDLDRKTFLHTPQAYLPWIMREYRKMILFDWNLFFEKDWSSLAGVDLGGNLVAASHDIEWQGEVNNVYAEKADYAKNFLGIEDVFGCFNTSVLVMDFEAIRAAFTIDHVFNLARSYKEPLLSIEIVNVLYQGRAARLPQRWNVKVSTEEGYALTVQDAPFSLFKEYQAACKDPIIVQYNQRDPWWLEGTKYEEKYWGLARASSLYEFFVEHMVSVHDAAGKHGRTKEGPLRRKLDKILPKGSRRRAFFKRVFPHGSSQYRAVKGLVSRIAN